MKTIFTIPLAAVLLAGCAQNDIAKNRSDKRRVAYVASHDYFKDRRTITGSNIPLAKGQIPFAQVSANTPSQSFSRERPSLYPTEPIVGATENTEPGTAPSNVGAGPAGSHPVLPGDQ